MGLNKRVSTEGVLLMGGYEKRAILRKSSGRENNLTENCRSVLLQKSSMSASEDIPSIGPCRITAARRWHLHIAAPCVPGNRIRKSDKRCAKAVACTRWIDNFDT